ncbi:MAG: hypothetical protein H6934_03335 [Burkholderiaceae bacterium]|nr:hypothetical protein [Burkholderiaceae bacterium]
MARTNYSYEKRQRELAKKRKKEEKRQKKLTGKDDEAGAPDVEATEGDAAAPADAGANGDD